MKQLITFLLLLCNLAISFGQEAVVLEKTRHLDILLEQGELQITEANHTETEFLENINMHARDVVFYSEMDPLLSFEAFTKIPHKKGKYKNAMVEVIETKDIVDPGIFYGGYKKKEFVYPSVVPNSIGVLNFTKENNESHIISPFYFDDYYQVDNAAFSVSFPNTVKVDYNLFNTEDLNLKLSIDSTDEKITYSWNALGLERRTYDSNAPSRSYLSPHIILRINSYQADGETIAVSGTTDDLFEWYNKLINRIPESKTMSNLESKVAELLEQSSNREESIKNIYSWVQNNVKYIAFEDGMAGFIPRAAGDVFEKKYGDCKDMANLLTTMLNKANIPCYLTWVGTNTKPYSYHEVPCTVTDNHMICAVKENGQFQILDPTNTYLQYGTSPSLLQGKEALIRIDDENYEIVKVSETEYSKNSRSDLLNLKIEDNVLSGKTESTLSGYLAEGYYYSKLSKEYNKETNFIQNYLEIGQKSSEYDAGKIEETPNEIKFTFDGSFKNNVIQANNKIYINLNLDPSTREYLIDDIETRTHPIQENFKQLYTYKCNLEIPEGFEVDYLPEDSEINFKDFSLSSKYKVEGNTISLEKTIVSDYLFLEKDQFKNYDVFYDEILEVSQQQISLKN